MEGTAILRRGTELYYLGYYPVILTRDIEIPRFGNEERQAMMLPCTSITAYGDKDAEDECTILYSVRELKFNQNK